MFLLRRKLSSAVMLVMGLTLGLAFSGHAGGSNPTHVRLAGAYTQFYCQTATNANGCLTLSSDEGKNFTATESVFNGNHDTYGLPVYQACTTCGQISYRTGTGVISVTLPHGVKVLNGELVLNIATANGVGNTYVPLGAHRSNFKIYTTRYVLGYVTAKNYRVLGHAQLMSAQFLLHVATAPVPTPVGDTTPTCGSNCSGYGAG